jgi:hypothetical protein
MSPARPTVRMVMPELMAPAVPMTRLRFETSPSLAPSTAARSALPPWRCRPSSSARVLPDKPPGIDAAICCTIRRWERSARPPATDSGCPSDCAPSRCSRLLKTGSTNCGPKRRASHASARGRQPKRMGPTCVPVLASCCRQNSACASSTTARRRKASRRRASGSASARAW